MRTTMMVAGGLVAFGLLIGAVFLLPVSAIGGEEGKRDVAEGSTVAEIVQNAAGNLLRDRDQDRDGNCGPEEMDSKRERTQDRGQDESKLESSVEQTKTQERAQEQSQNGSCEETEPEQTKTQERAQEQSQNGSCGETDPEQTKTQDRTKTQTKNCE